MDDSITLKGIRDGLLVTIKPGGKWSDRMKRLVALIDGQGNFFRGAQVMLSVGPRELRQKTLQDAQKMLAKRGVTLVGVLSENMNTTGAALKLGLRVDLGAAEMASRQVTPPAPRKPPRIDPEERGTPGVLLDRTLRNGRIVHSEGHVVVLGDVNAGAVIVADGDVIVWGRLRGVVHAGAGGDESAVVCALYLAPTQLRIAGYISISPEARPGKPQPEKAMVRNGRIEAIAWDYRNMG